MKAEHRKELERNVLRERMSQAAEALKQKPTSGVYYVVGVVLLVVAIFGVWKYISVSTAKSTSERWTRLDEIRNVTDLGPFIEKNAGTPAARTARFEQARYRLQQGVENLGSPTQHASAVDNLKAARTLYEELLPVSRDVPVLAQEAMMGRAKAEESLSATPNPENAAEMLGSLDKAVELYTQLKDAYPDTFQAKAAEARIKEITEKRDKIQAFYTELNKQMAKK
jgi:hypothetical protein